MTFRVTDWTLQIFWLYPFAWVLLVYFDQPLWAVVAVLGLIIGYCCILLIERLGDEGRALAKVVLLCVLFGAGPIIVNAATSTQ
jgi:hypothetical protein